MKLRFSLRGFIKVAPYVLTGLWTLTVLAMWLCLAFQFDPFGIWGWELRSFNARFHNRGPVTPDPRIVFLAIDDASVLGESIDDEDIKRNPGFEYLKDFPYHRKAWAVAIEKLVNAGAKAVVFDILITKGSPLGTGAKGKADDKALADAIRKYRDKVVIGANHGTTDIGGGAATTKPLMLPSSTVLPDEKDVAMTNVVGFVNFNRDMDGMVRQMNPHGWPYVPQGFDQDVLPYSIDALGVKKAFPQIRLPAHDEGRYIIFSGPNGTYDPIPFYFLFKTKSWDRDRPPLFGGTIFKDKIVFIGPRANFLHDEHFAPFGDGRDGNPEFMFGPDVHLHAISTLLSERNLQPMTFGQGLLLIAIVGLSYMAILPMARSPFGKFVPAVAFGWGYLWLAQKMFEGYDLFIPLVPVEIIIVGSALSVIAFQAIAEQIEKLRVSGMFQQYVSKNVAEELIKSGRDVDSIMAPQKRTVTMLFSDVRDFTTMTEKSEPGPFVAQLNEYLTAMVECVFNNHGTLDKFVGDAVVAVFGSPTSRGLQEDAWCAVKTAVEMRARLAELNARWKKEGKESFRFGIGLNHGDVMAGDIGSNQKKEYGVIGDAVNVAARVESETKSQKTDILITDSVYQLVKDRVDTEHRGGIHVKGRTKEVDMYALNGLKA